MVAKYCLPALMVFVGATQASTSTHRQPRQQSLQDTIEVRRLAAPCAVRSRFIEVCSDHLMDDPDSDGIISQTEYADFLENSLSCYFPEPEGKTPSPRLSCRGTGRAPPRAFTDLELSLKVKYLRELCKHVNKNQNGNDCFQNLLTNDLNGERFGFKKDEASTEIVDLCTSVYSGAVRAGYISECNLVQPVPGRVDLGFSYGIRTNGIDASSFMSGQNPVNTLKDALIEATTETVLAILDDSSRRRVLVSDFFAEDSAHMPHVSLRGNANSTAISQKQKDSQHESRRLATYDPSVPVVITRAMDDVCRKPPAETINTKCLYIKTTITVFIAEDESEIEVRKLFMDGFRQRGIRL